MPRDDAIRTIEEISLNAWPSLQTILVDGWVLRFANGYTKRANSINPLYASTSNADEKIRLCEQIYRGKRLPVVFKVTSAVHPENLDALLEKRGFAVDSPTNVQTMNLINKNFSRIAELNATITTEWLNSFCRMNKIDQARIPTMQTLLANIVPQKCFAAIRHEDKIIACGLGVLQYEHIGFYDIVTDASFRKQGYGTQLMTSLLAWGRQNGAKNAYLQVMQNNAPALHLYSQLGFTPAYEVLVQNQAMKGKKGLISTRFALPIATNIVTTRRATLTDAPTIADLVNLGEREGQLLPRPIELICASIDDWMIALDDNRIVGVGSLLEMGNTLSEIRSLAVAPAYRKHGIGAQIVNALIDLARERKIPTVFALTRAVLFFEKLGFIITDKENFPEKVWRDCSICPVQFACDEVAMVKSVASKTVISR